MKRKLQRVISKVDVDASVDAVVPNKVMCTGKCNGESCDTGDKE